MPSVSKKQHNLMAMVANDPAAAKRTGVPQSVGEEYVQADKGKKFGGGTKRARPDLQKVNKSSTRHGKSELFSGGGMAESKKMVGKEIAFMKKKGAPKSMVKHEESEMAGMKKGGVAKYAKGGFIAPSKMGAVKTAAPSRDGVATKGKTQGTQIKMKRGGKC
jgi:hypothetical protein